MKAMMWSAAALIGILGTAMTVVAMRVPVDSEVIALQVAQVGKMSVERAAHQATLLASGHVLITGGCDGQCDSALASVERYDPATRSFQDVASMATPRNSHVAIALPDGRVLVAGGWAHRAVTANAEIFDPATQRFTQAGALNQPRAASTATRLPNGRILITGGQTTRLDPLASVEIFDPAASSFSTASPMQTARVGHAAVALADGRVLIIGGRQVQRGETLRSAEIFDPTTGVFGSTGQMSSPRHKHAAVRLADGRVLVIGGSDARDQRGRYKSTEIYDPATGEFSPGPEMRWPRFKLPDAVVVLPSGAVLVAGGAAQLEFYDPVGQTFVPVNGRLSGPREFATASLLRSGDILVLGGYDENIQTSASAWLVRVSR